jgi:competence protein ComFC
MKYIMVWKQIYKYVLCFLFEKDEALVEIESMGTEEFKKKARPSTVPFARFLYRDPLVKTLIWNLKFRKNKECFRLAGALIYGKIQTMGPALIIPIPLSSKRHWERGYNQVECLAREIEKLDNGILFEIGSDAVKRKNAPAQTSLSRKERLKNIEGMFWVARPERIKDRDIIILDDVITTGATAKELEKVLREAGARSVRAIAIAH